MDINNIKLNIQNVGFRGTQLKNRVFSNQPADTFASSKPTLKEAVKMISSLKNNEGDSRFDKEEINEFKKFYKNDKIDLDTTKAFAGTELNIDSISKIYGMQKDCGNDFKKNEIPKIKEQVLKLEQDGNAVDFSQSIYEPKEEYTLRALSFSNSSIKEKTYQKDGALIVQKAYYGAGSYKIEKSYDLRNKLTSTKYTEIDDNQNRILERELIERVDNNGNLLRKEELTKSAVKGVYNLTYTYPDGKKEDVVKATVNQKTGIKTVKKDMKSSNGTRTEFLYEDDPKGNRIIDYKITDKDGKVLMKDSQTFEVISDNKFISSKNHRKYEIELNDKEIKVKDLHNEKEVKLDFKTKVSNEKEEVINLLKKVSGDELFETVDTVSNIIGLKKEEILEAGFSAYKKWINAGDNLFAFLHELGHAKDSEYRTEKDVEKQKHNYFYRNNENIKKAYLKEKTLFNENYSDSQRDNMKYFLNVKTHYAGETGGLSEVIAETNALTSSITSADLDELGVRAQYLQQHFPETIATIKKEMEYKHDIEAIEFYGT